MARIHRVIGLGSFHLMVAHIVMIIAGYASGGGRQVPSTTWDLITGYGGVLLAVAGTVCLIMVVATSIRAARRRLRYESWHLLHLYAYLGVGLALPHQLWTGQEFLARQGPRFTGGRYGQPRRPRCWSGGSGCRCGAACGTGCGSPR